MRDTSERVAGTAKGNHQLRRRRTEEGGTRHGKPCAGSCVTYLLTYLVTYLLRTFTVRRVLV